MLWKHLAFGQFKNWAMLWNKNGKNWEDRERRCREREIGWFRLERKKLCNNKNNYHEKQRLQWWCSENLTANTFFSQPWIVLSVYTKWIWLLFECTPKFKLTRSLYKLSTMWYSSWCSNLYTRYMYILVFQIRASLSLSRLKRSI